IANTANAKIYLKFCFRKIEALPLGNIKPTLTIKSFQMKKLGLLFAATAVIVFTGCKNQKKDMDPMDGMNDSTSMDTSATQDSTIGEAKTLTIALASKSGSTVQGEAIFTE